MFKASFVMLMSIIAAVSAFYIIDSEHKDIEHEIVALLTYTGSIIVIVMELNRKPEQ